MVCSQVCNQTSVHLNSNGLCVHVSNHQQCCPPMGTEGITCPGKAYPSNDQWISIVLGIQHRAVLCVLWAAAGSPTEPQTRMPQRPLQRGSQSSPTSVILVQIPRKSWTPGWDSVAPSGKRKAQWEPHAPRSASKRATPFPNVLHTVFAHDALVKRSVCFKECLETTSLVKAKAKVGESCGNGEKKEPRVCGLATMTGGIVNASTRRHAICPQLRRPL